MLWGVIIFIAVILDRISKMYIVRHIGFTKSIPVINNFFYITYWENKGAAWGILQGGRYAFIILTVIISAGILHILYRSENKILKLSLSIILGGAVGNFIDRVYKGSVVDFLEFHFGSYQFPIFNVADSCVVVGTILLAYYLLFIYKDKKEKNTNDELSTKEE
jgi:signal peptidase II